MEGENGLFAPQYGLILCLLPLVSSAYAIIVCFNQCFPKIILADEPTGNLDEDTAHDVTELLVERARSLNKCVIIVSHSNEVAAEGDVILRFSHGKIEVSS